MQMIDSAGFTNKIDRECSKKIFKKIKEFVDPFYKKTIPQNREKELIVFLTPVVKMLRIAEEKKVEYFRDYDNLLAKEYDLPKVNYQKGRSSS